MSAAQTLGFSTRGNIAKSVAGKEILVAKFKKKQDEHKEYFCIFSIRHITRGETVHYKSTAVSVLCTSLKLYRGMFTLVISSYSCGCPTLTAGCE